MTQPEFSTRLHKAVETVRLYLAFIHKSFDKDNCWQASSALSFTTLFAVVPLMLVVFSVVSAIPAFSQWDTEVRAFISRNLIPASGAEVLGYIERFAEQAGHLTAAGVLILFATAVLLLRTIEQSINRIWEVEHPRRELVSFLLYWAIISLGPLLLVGGIAMSSFIGSHTGLDLNLLFLAPWLLTWLAFSLVYIFVPNCFVPWRAGVVGALVAATLFEVAKLVFARFVADLSSYQMIYGAFALFPVFLLWVHICWAITLLGVEIVKALVMFHPRAHESADSHWFQMLDILSLLYDCQQRGKPLTAEELREYLLEIGCESWSPMREFLLNERIIAITEKGDFVLARDLTTYPLSELMLVNPVSLGQWSTMVEGYATVADSDSVQAETSRQWAGLMDEMRGRFSDNLADVLVRLHKQKTGETI